MNQRKTDTLWIGDQSTSHITLQDICSSQKIIHIANEQVASVLYWLFKPGIRWLKPFFNGKHRCQNQYNSLPQALHLHGFVEYSNVKVMLSKEIGASASLRMLPLLKACELNFKSPRATYSAMSYATDWLKLVADMVLTGLLPLQLNGTVKNTV